MIQIIREIGIFIVIAQAVLYFVPGESYVKYVKVIIGVIMIARMAQPLLLLVNGQEWEQMLEGMPDFRDFSELEGQVSPENGRERIEGSIERELLQKLGDEPAEGYLVRKVALVGTGEEGGEAEIVITVSKEPADGGKIRIEKIAVGGEEPPKEELPQLKEHYGKILGTQPERIRIVTE